MQQIPSFQVSFTDDEVQESLSSIEKVLRSGQLALNGFTKQLEDSFLKYSGCKYAIAVSSGTVALEIIFRALNLQGKEILIQTNTNFATLAAALYAGAKPKLYDCGLEPMLSEIKKKVTKQTRAVVVVHIGGFIGSEMEDIAQFCKDNDLYLIEDAAHAHGSVLNSKFAGSFGTAAAFSFYPTKVLTTCEGGMITTNKQSLYKQATIYRDQGKDASGIRNVVMGSSWRMSEVHAAIGCAHIKTFAKDTKARQKIMAFYQKKINSKHVPLPYRSTLESSGYKYIIELENQRQRDSLKRFLVSKGITVSKGVYDVPLHRQPVFQKFNNSTFPLAEMFAACHLCLPLWRHMTLDQAKAVVDTIHEWTNFYRD